MTLALLLLLSATGAMAAPGSYSGNVHASSGPSWWWLNLAWIAVLVWYWIKRNDGA